MESNAEGIPKQKFTMDFDAEIISLLHANADRNNWEDQELPSPVWKKAYHRWQAFAAKWREHSGPVYKVVNDARIIDFSDIRYLVADLPPSILVRTCYDDAVTATLRTAATRGSGMIFTGQPGIGKTTFLLYLLVVLLQRKQVVLLTLVPSQPPLLFYHDGVYKATTSPNIEDFPYPEGPVLIWSLFEAHQEHLSQCAYYAPVLFPVQAPSPNPKLYDGWQKRRYPVFSRFPLWDFKELKEGLRLHADFALLQQQLGLMLETWQDHSRDSSFKYSRALKLLRTACGDERPESVDVAVDVLLEACIAAFGRVAREVFKAICDPDGYDDVLSRHNAAYVGYEELKDIIEVVARSNFGTHVSHRAVCILPDGLVGRPVMRWNVAFKSDQIAEEISAKWANAQEGRVRELMTYLSAAPAGQALVGWFFEALAHRRILAGADAQEYWSLKPMTFQRPSTFLVDKSAVSVPRISKKALRRVTFDTQDITSKRLKLRDDEYHIPNITNFPLIDSFLVTFARGSSAAPSADLWLFHMTMSVRHRGASKGYEKITDIISILENKLKLETQTSESPPAKRQKQSDGKSEEVRVRVHYILACPPGEDKREWVLPPGWADNVKGDGFFMEIDVLH